MKLTKNQVTIVRSLWNRYSIKNLYANVRIDVTLPLHLFAYVRILMDPPSVRT